MSELVKRLREGVPQRPRRWSGDTHSDLGGTAMEDEADATMAEAADRIEALEAENARLREFYNAAVKDGAEDDPNADDDESIGWIGDAEITMTYGHIRRAAQEDKP